MESGHPKFYLFISLRLGVIIHPSSHRSCRILPRILKLIKQRIQLSRVHPQFPASAFCILQQRISTSAGSPSTRSNRPDPIVWVGGGRSEVYFKFWVTCNLCSIRYPEKVGSFPYWLACGVVPVGGDPFSGLGNGSGHVIGL
jgi:hypothetical protein